MYELIILSLLMRAPMHGYLLAKITNDKIGPWARVSNGTLYPMLARLERDGCIAATDGGEGASDTDQPPTTAGTASTADRTYRRYAITEQGRRRFHALMLDTSTNISAYKRVFRQKVPSFPLLPATERNFILDHYLSYCETCIQHYEREARDLERRLNVPDAGTLVEEDVANPTVRLELEAALLVLGRQAEEWHAERAWARRLRDRTWPIDISRLLTTTSMRPPERRGRFPHTRGEAPGEPATEQTQEQNAVRDAVRDEGTATHQGGDHHAHA